MPQGRLLSFKLFLEGIEVDFISASMVAGVGMPAQAQIEIPPADSAHTILPRTLVHLFYFETNYEQRTDGEGKTSAHLLGQNDKTDPTKWKILFAGEVMGYGYRQVGGTRNIVLQCQDFVSYWQSAKLYFGTGYNSLTSFRRTMFAGATQVYAGKQKVSGGSALLNLITSRPTLKPSLPGLLGGIVNLLESATGVFDHPTNKFRGVNDFMTQAELRLRLSRMVGASEDDDSSQAYLNHGDLRLYFQQLTAAYGGDMTIWDIAQSLLGKINHQYSSLLAYPFHKKGAPAKLRYQVPAGSSTGLGKDIDKIAEQTSATIKVIDDYTADASKRRAENPTMLKHDATRVHGADATGNIIETGEIAAKQQAYATALKKAGLVGVLKNESELLQDNPTIPGATYNNIGDLASIGVTPTSEPGKRSTQIADLGAAYADQKKKGWTSRQQAEADLVRGALVDIGFGQAWAAKTALLSVVENPAATLAITPATPSTTAVASVPVHHSEEQIAAARKRLSAGLTKLTKVSQAYKTITVNTHLASQMPQMLLTPDLYMVPPPACNVIFPDQYNSLMYSRDFQAEPTRLWLFGRTTFGMDKQDMYFSPSTDILTLANTQIAEQALKQGTSFLMPHEIYTGIIPVLEPLGDNMVYRQLNKEAKKDAKGKLLPQNITNDGQETIGQARYSPQEHMQRAANYTFLSKRFESRQISLNMRFSPQLMVGVPALILCPTPTLEGALSPNGTHFLGMVAQVSHQIHSSGSSVTTVALTKTRAHTEGIDLFGQQDENGYVISKKVVEKKIPDRRRVYVGDAAAVTDKNVNVLGKVLSDFGIIKPGKSVAITGSDTIANNSSWFTADAHRSITTKVGGKYVTVNMHLRDAQGGKVYNAKEAAEYRKLVKDNAAGAKKVLAGGSFTGDAKDIDRLYVQPLTTEQAALRAESKSYLNQNSVLEVSIESQGSYYTNKPITFSFEATATPPWFASIYMPMQIGNGFYQPMFGCGSVLDKAPIEQTGSRQTKAAAAKDAAAIEQAAAEKTAAVEAMEAKELARMNKVERKRYLKERALSKSNATKGAAERAKQDEDLARRNDTTPKAAAEDVEPVKATGTFLFDGKEIELPTELFSQPLTVKEAADYLARTWIELQENGADMAKYVDTYTQRSHATLHDILGNNPYVVMNDVNMQAWPDDEPGFHAEAFGLVGGLDSAVREGSSLIPDSLVQEVPNKFGKEAVAPRKVDPRTDPRLNRYVAISQYTDELRKRRTNLQ